MGVRERVVQTLAYTGGVHAVFGGDTRGSYSKREPRKLRRQHVENGQGNDEAQPQQVGPVVKALSTLFIVLAAASLVGAIGAFIGLGVAVGAETYDAFRTLIP
jgi:hypothetical protein